MILKLVSLLCFLSFVCTKLSAQESSIPADKYLNYKGLSEHEVEEQDFRISISQRNTNVTVFAIHGGKIDWGTSELASAIAGQDLNLYLFEGIKPKDNIQLHIASNHFDEPKALELASLSEKCLSVHGHKYAEQRICVGGSDVKLREKIFGLLKEQNFPFKIQMLCPGLEGTNKNNIVNRCKNEGVQLEFSSTLRQVLSTNKSLLTTISNTLRSALKN
jgi:phage replication-related protein YjqB (UPF0714/DUF867 family)